VGGLLDALIVGRSAVDAARAGIEITGHNIANASTLGFHRRRLQQSAVEPPPVLGGGVRIDGGTRVADNLLARRVAAAMADQGRADTRETLLLQVEQASASVGEGGIGNAISAFFSSLSALSAAPADPTVRSQVLASAAQLADAFRSASEGLDTVADGADHDLVPALAEVNQKAARVAELNASILSNEAGGQEASDLRDERDLLVGDLARIAGAQTITDGSGQLTVLVGGLTLVQGDHAATLEAAPDAALGGRSRIDLVEGAMRLDLTGRLQSGEIGGRLQVRDQVVPAVQAQLDQLAYDLATRVNTQHRAGFGLDGIGGRDLFAPPAAVPGAAAALQLQSGITAREVAAASAAGLPGNSENAIALNQLSEGQYAGGGTATFDGQVAAIVGGVGTIVAAGEREASLRQDELGYLQSLRESKEGVSLDEEMTQLVAYQRSYQAGVRVLQAVDAMMQEILRL